MLTHDLFQGRPACCPESVELLAPRSLFGNSHTLTIVLQFTFERDLNACKQGNEQRPMQVLSPSKRLLQVVVILCVSLTGCQLMEPVPPVAEAGDTLTVDAGAPLQLDASSSFDPDNAELVNFQWRIVGTPEDRADRRGEVIAEGSTAVLDAGTPFGDADVGRWELELEVTDATDRRATDTVFVDVER